MQRVCCLCCCKRQEKYTETVMNSVLTATAFSFGAARNLPHKHIEGSRLITQRKLFPTLMGRGAGAHIEFLQCGSFGIRRLWKWRVKLNFVLRRTRDEAFAAGPKTASSA